MSSKPKVAVIGVGNMGSALAERLLSQGYDVTVFNRTREKCEALRLKGAHVASDVANALMNADVVICALFDGVALREVVLGGITGHVLNDRPFINVAHTTPEEIAALGVEFGARGARLSEVDVIAYPHNVRAGVGDYVIAGPEEDRRSWEALFRDLGGTVHHIGALGDASRCEMALWLPFAFQTIAIAYTTAAFAKERLSMSVLQGVLSGSPLLRIAGAEQAIPPMVQRQYGTNQWSVDNMLSSLDILIRYASGLGLPTEVFGSIRELYRQTAQRGLGLRDHMAVHEVLLGP